MLVSVTLCCFVLPGSALWNGFSGAGDLGTESPMMAGVDTCAFRSGFPAEERNSTSYSYMYKHKHLKLVILQTNPTRYSKVL